MRYGVTFSTVLWFVVVVLTVQYIYYVQTKPNDVNRTDLLQKALLEYLAHGSENDPSLVVSVCAHMW